MRGREAGLATLALIIILLALLALRPVPPASTPSASPPGAASGRPSTPITKATGSPARADDAAERDSAAVDPEPALGPRDVEPPEGSRWSGASTAEAPGESELGESACLIVNLMVSRESWQLSYARLRVRPWRARRKTARCWTLHARDADGREASQAFPVRGLLPHGHEAVGEVVLGDEHLQAAVPVVVRLPGLRLPVTLELRTPEGNSLAPQVLRELGEQRR